MTQCSYLCKCKCKASCTKSILHLKVVQPVLYKHNLETKVAASDMIEVKENIENVKLLYTSFSLLGG